MIEAEHATLGLYHEEVMAVICLRCGAMMRLLNRSRTRVQLYWCPGCQRFQETQRPRP